MQRTFRLTLAVAMFVTSGAVNGGDIEGCGSAEVWRDGNSSQIASRCHQLAAQGDAHAQLVLGVMYGLGKGVPRDYAEAIRWLQKAADQDLAGAEFGLGFMYENGLGVSQDYAEAVTWYQRAADQASANAQYSLAQMYKRGHGIQRNYAEAARWFNKAAMQGHPGAEYFLGFMHEAGWGVTRDLVQAYMWFDVAARSTGDTAHQQYAIQYRDSVASRMNLSQLFQAKILTAEWRPEPLH